MNRSIYALALLALPVVTGACSSATDNEGETEGAVSSLTSGYTDLGDINRCAEDSTAPSLRNCGGQGGYSLLPGFDEGYTYLIVRSPNHKEFELDISSYVPHEGSTAFGPKAEWRGTFASPGQVNPKALIFRILHPTPQVPNKSTLLVAKLTPDAACIYASVDGNIAGGNEKARAEVARVDSVTCPTQTPPLDGTVTSEYTPLDDPEAGGMDKQCKQLPGDPNCKGECGAAWDCGGMGEYGVTAEWGDGCSNVIVRSSTGEHDLNLWCHFGAWASLGPKAEWRGVQTGPGKVNPFALIFRYLSVSGEYNPSTGDYPHHHYLFVTKLTPEKPCVFAVIDATAHDHANVLAREAAERARTGQCPAATPAPQ
jgi:hypothetical protein